MPQFNVVCLREVDPLPRNKAKISLRIGATDGKTIIHVADVEVTMHAPVVDMPGRFVIEELTKVLTELGALGKVQTVGAGALDLLNGGHR